MSDYVRNDAATVRLIQTTLSQLGYDPGAVDGIWGKHTELALEAFQADMGLQVDGIPGPDTLSALSITPAASVVSPSAGNADGSPAGTVSQGTIVIQLDLQALGYDVAGESAWGPKTDAAVRSYQRSHGLQVDGIVGPNTWASLQASIAAGSAAAQAGGVSPLSSDPSGAPSSPLSPAATPAHHAKFLEYFGLGVVAIAAGVAAHALIKHNPKIKQAIGAH